MSYVLVGKNSKGEIAVLGTKWARPFQFEGPATAHLGDAECDFPDYDWIVVQLQKGPDGKHPGQGGAADPAFPLYS